MRLRLFVAAAALLSASLAAHADTLTYSFSFSGSGNSGSGTFDLTSTATAGEYQITGISGTTTVDGYSSSDITSLLAPGTYPPDNPTFPDQASDNLAFPSGSTFLDYQGVSFLLANGQDVNLFYDSGPYGIVATDLDGGTDVDLSSFSVTLVPTPTPEPSSILLLGTGLLGMVGVVRKRFA